MKRAWMKKVKAVSISATKAMSEEQLKPVQPKIKRRVRTSVAMMAIAISMGGPNLLLTRQERTPAAELPPGEEPTANTTATVATTTSPQQVTSAVGEIPTPTVESVPSRLPAKNTVSQPTKPLAAKTTVAVTTPPQTASVEVASQQMVVDTPQEYTQANTVVPSQVDAVNSQPTQNSASTQAAQRQELVQKLKSATPKQSLTSAVQQNSFSQPASSNAHSQLQVDTAPATINKNSNAINAQQRLLVNRLKQQSNSSISSAAKLRSEEFSSSTTITTEARQPNINRQAASSVPQNQAPTVVTPDVERSPLVGQSNQNFIVNTTPQIPSASIFNNSPVHSLNPLNNITPTRTPQTPQVEPSNSVVVDVKEPLRTSPVTAAQAEQEQHINTPASIATNEYAVSGQYPSELETPSGEFGVTNELQNATSSTQDTVAQTTETPTSQTLVQRLKNRTTDPENLKSPEPEIETVYVISQAPEDTSAVSVQAVSSTAYQVKPGDTLTAIAREYGIPLQELVQANQIPNPDQLQIDQSITIPTSAYNNSVAQNIDKSDRPLQQHTAMVAANLQAVVVPTVTTTANDSESHSTLVAYNNPTANAQVVNNSTGIGGSLSNEEPLDPPSFYVQGLQAEIKQLRQKYSNQSTSVTTAAVEEQVKVAKTADAASAQTKSVDSVANHLSRSRPTSAKEPVNPEFRVAQASTSNSKIIRARLSTAPTNAEPTEALHSLRGRQVSPELPPLGAADMYLPRTGMSAPFTGYIWPAKGVFTSGYGWRWGRMHRGIDVAAPVGTPIFAAASGVVVRAGWNSGGYGNLVDIRHPNGSLTRYAHNNRILVRAGQEVEQGQHIAEMGSTGFSTGPHLHFEVHHAGKGAVNPIALLPRR